MPEKSLAKYSAKIKDVYIELKNYKFFHSPYSGKEGKSRFIGREKVKNRIISILNNAKVKSGAYLITGFRGMGKTSVVREALEDFNTKVEQKYSQHIKTNEAQLALNELIGEFSMSLRLLLGYLFIYLLLCSVIFESKSFNDLKIFLYLIYTVTIFLFIILNNKKVKSIILEILEIIKNKSRNENRESQPNEYRESQPNEKKKSERLHLILILNLLIFSLILVIPFLIINLVLSENNLSSFQSISTYDMEFIVTFIYGLNLILINKSDRFFGAAWNFFRISFLIISLAVTIVFAIDYNYICDKKIYKNTVCSKTVKDSLELNFPAVIKLAKTESTSPNDVEKKGEYNVFILIFRLLLGLLFFYLLVSFILFITDYFSFIKTKSFKNSSNHQTEQYEKFEINLSQDSLDEMDILRRMTIALEEFWLKKKFEFDDYFFRRKIYFPFRYIISILERPRKERSEPSYKSVLAKLSLLRNRMSGQVTSRREQQPKHVLKTPIAGVFEIESQIGSYVNLDEVAFQVANVKEAEDLLEEILDNIDTLRLNKKDWKIKQFAFIIDELDKIDPQDNLIQDKESANLVVNTAQETNRFRQRREAVGRLLANLKGFLNVVKAKFFFIGGREMFDADLAGIADRESFYSSIFNDVIYVESFFKDSTDKKMGPGGITQMTEAFVCNIISDNLSDYDGEIELRLKTLFQLLEDYKSGDTSCLLMGNKKVERKSDSTESRLKKYKVIFTLQNYIIYLVYRSNGTPKKLTGLTESLIVKGPHQKKNKDFFNDNVVVLHETKDLNNKKQDLENIDLSEKLFLKFSFNTQYEIGITSNLYRPFLIANSRHIKSLGDKLLFSSSFIIDHILKFHPFGFSWRNLELIPEIVLVNREPNLREFIEELMRFYSLNYIRDTVSGIFDYRFRGIIRRELIHLSKTSDLSSAAFNFTLDESLAIKRHYKRKQIEIQRNYQNRTPLEGDNQFIHSLCFVETILGDLHFYDKEYDEAILYYTESIQTLRLPDAVTKRKLTRHQFLLWLRNKLKLGLTLEKIRAFDSAFSLYKTLILDTERYFKNIVSKEEGENFNFEDAEDHRTIQLVSMPFVAHLAVTEKARNDGITYTNLFSNRNSFLRTIGALSENLAKFQDEIETNDKEFDFFRKFFLMADYYNNIGSILFYKNCQFTHFFDNDNYCLEVFSEDKKENKLISSLQIQKNLVSDCLENVAVSSQPSHYANGVLGILEKQKKLYKKSADGRAYDYFPSLSSFNYYWNSLYFLVKYHRRRIIETEIFSNSEVYKLEIKTKPNEGETLALKDNLLAMCSCYLLPECLDMVSSNRFYYLANVVSKIGDSILASLRKQDFTIPKDLFEPLDLNSQDSKSKENRLNFIKKFRQLVGVEDNLFTAETVLYTYKLASALYKRSGHSSYFSSQQTKILYLIKDLIELNKDSKNFKKNLGTFLLRKEQFVILKKDKAVLIKLINAIRKKYLKEIDCSQEDKEKERVLNRYIEICQKSLKVFTGIATNTEYHLMDEWFGQDFPKIEKKTKHFLNSLIGESIGMIRMQTKIYINQLTEFIDKNPNKQIELVLKKLESIAEGIFLATTWNNEVSNRPQILKYREIFNIKADRGKDRDVIYHNINNVSDNKEVVVLIEGIRLKLRHKDPNFIDDFTRARNIISAYASINNRYQRMLELKYRTERCYFIMIEILKLKVLFDCRMFEPKQKTINSLPKQTKFNEIAKSLGKIIQTTQGDFSNNSITFGDVTEFLIREALFCSSQLIKMIKLYNPGYLIGYSFIAEAHSRMGAWCQAYENYRKLFENETMIKNWKNQIEDKDVKIKELNKEKKLNMICCDQFKDSPEYQRLKKELENLYTESNELNNNLNRIINFDKNISKFLDAETLSYLEPKNHYESALQYYYRMIQIHSDGKSYREKLHELFMLEDDYNDNLAHYVIAAERIRINSGNTKEKINKLKKKLTDSKLYKYSSFLTANNDKTDSTNNISLIESYIKYFNNKINTKLDNNPTH